VTRLLSSPCRRNHSHQGSRFSHIFDGVRLNTETAAFQLCDIHDETLKQMIESADEEDLRDECDVCELVLFVRFHALHAIFVKATDGWYTSQALEKIKVILRHKFFQLLQGHVATEEECEALLNEPPSRATMKSRVPKLRMGKHNMAKGALPPEELAVRVWPRETLSSMADRDFQAMRLHAQLQKNMQKRS